MAQITAMQAKTALGFGPRQQVPHPYLDFLKVPDQGIQFQNIILAIIFAKKMFDLLFFILRLTQNNSEFAE